MWPILPISIWILWTMAFSYIPFTKQSIWSNTTNIPTPFSLLSTSPTTYPSTVSSITTTSCCLSTTFDNSTADAFNIFSSTISMVAIITTASSTMVVFIITTTTISWSYTVVYSSSTTTSSWTYTMVYSSSTAATCVSVFLSTVSAAITTTTST